MLKSFEAIYHNGHLHWTGPKPPSVIEKSRVLVVVDIETDAVRSSADMRILLERSRGCIKPTQSVESS